MGFVCLGIKEFFWEGGRKLMGRRLGRGKGFESGLMVRRVFIVMVRL